MRILILLSLLFFPLILENLFELVWLIGQKHMMDTIITTTCATRGGIFC